MNHYPFDTRVYLRRDPSQYGLIGCGGYGDVYDRETRTQLVFWQHPGADVVTPEQIDDLMDEQEYRERRRLFMRAMRHPEMQMVRAALADMVYEHEIELSGITSLEVMEPLFPCAPWMLETSQHLSVCYWPSYHNAHPEFCVVRLHDATDKRCPCEFCIMDRQCAAANYARLFEHIGENLKLLVDELEIDISAVRTIGFEPHCPIGTSWWIDIDGVQYAWIERCSWSGVCEVQMSGTYGDYASEEGVA